MTGTIQRAAYREGSQRWGRAGKGACVQAPIPAARNAYPEMGLECGKGTRTSFSASHLHVIPHFILRVEQPFLIGMTTIGQVGLTASRATFKNRSLALEPAQFWEAGGNEPALFS